MARSAARLSMVPGLARFAGGSGLGRGVGGARGAPGARAANEPGLVPRQPGLALPRGLAQPGFPGGLWRPGATGSGTWRPALTPAASTVAPADGPTAAPPGGPTAAPAGGPAAASSSWRAPQTPHPGIPHRALGALSLARPPARPAGRGHAKPGRPRVPPADAPPP